MVQLLLAIVLHRTKSFRHVLAAEPQINKSKHQGRWSLTPDTMAHQTTRISLVSTCSARPGTKLWKRMQEDSCGPQAPAPPLLLLRREDHKRGKHWDINGSKNHISIGRPSHVFGLVHLPGGSTFSLRMGLPLASTRNDGMWCKLQVSPGRPYAILYAIGSQPRMASWPF